MAQFKSPSESDVADQSSKVFDQLSAWATRSFPEGDPLHRMLIEGALQVERELQDVGNDTISAIVTFRIRLWIALADTSVSKEAERLYITLLLIKMSTRKAVAGAILKELSLLSDRIRAGAQSFTGALTLYVPDELRSSFGEPPDNSELDTANLVLGFAQLSEDEVDRFRRDMGFALREGTLIAGLISAHPEIRFASLPTIVVEREIATHRETRSQTSWLAPPKRSSAKQEIVHDARHVWQIEIHLPHAAVDAVIFGSIMWHLAGALESIDGVVCEVEDLRIGSAYAKLKVWIRNFIRRDEVKQVLEQGRDIAIAHLAKPVAESRQHLSDAKKLDLEGEKFAAEVERLPSTEQAAEAHELDLRIKRAQAEKAELEVAEARMTLVVRASELLAKGLIKTDDLEVRINDFPFLKYVGGVPTVGASMDEIERGESTPDEGER